MSHHKRRFSTTAIVLILLIWPTGACFDSEAESREVSVRTYGTTTQRTEPVTGTSTTTSTVPVESTEVATSSQPGTVIDRFVSYEEAEAAYHDGRFVEAMGLFTNYLEHRSDNVWGHFMLGMSARRAGDDVAAEESFRLGLEKDPTHVPSLVNLTRVLLDHDRPEEALESIDEALALDPESNSVYRVLGRVQYELGEVEHAIESYQEALEIDDRDVWSMNNLGLLLIREDRYDEAVFPLARATLLRDDIAIFHNNLGIVLEQRGLPGSAETSFRTAVELDPLHERAAVNLARVEGREDDPTVARFDVEQASQKFLEEIERWRAFPYDRVSLDLGCTD
ncbi:MAG: tetratricopeptide repeat protein [Gemmatimonadetes bacterium]|nr:tetratricopeptide repeat protein [Gemmatimonadota bacterium]